MLYNLYTSDIPKSTQTQPLILMTSASITRTVVHGFHNWQCNVISIRSGGGPPNGILKSLLRRQRLGSSQREPGCNSNCNCNLQNVEIEYVPRLRYLGVILDHKLNWTEHYETLKDKALWTFTAMKQLLMSSLSLKIKLFLF